MADGVQHIRHPSQLPSVSVWRTIWRRTPPRFRIEGNGASAERLRMWESQLSRLQGACGCEQGAVGLFAGLGIYLLFLLLRTGGWGHPGRREFWIGVAVIVSTTSVGKLLGLLLARRKLRRAIKEIQAEWRPQPLQGPGPVDARTRRTRSWVGPTPCCGARSSESPDVETARKRVP
jgi:hypothetical protein